MLGNGSAMVVRWKRGVVARWVLRSCAAKADSNGIGNVAHGPEMRLERGS